MKIKKILACVGVLVSTITIIGLGFVGNYFYNLALNPDTSKEIVFGSDDEEDETSGQVLQKDIDWILNNPNQTEEYINSFDNLKLHSYKILNENKTNNWIISVHGYGGDSKKVSTYARHFYDMGYNVLLPDLRGHGQSEGEYIGMGWHDRLDIINWINYILEEDKNANIMLHGVSMGAGTVTMVSGEKLSKNVKGIIADCGYTSAWDQFSYQLKTIFNLKEFPILQVSDLFAKVKAGYSIKDASAIEQVKKSNIPILYIHGDKDTFVPYYMMQELYDATPSKEKQMLTIKGAKHAKASEVNPKLYWKTIYEFTNKHMN